MTTRSAPHSFLGTGWAFPPEFGPGGAELATVSDVEDVHQSLAILFATRRGERAMQESFGCNLDEFLFEEIDHALVNRITNMIHDAILAHETRIELIEGAVELVFEVHLEGHPAQRQTIDLCLGATHGITQLLTGEHYQLKAVTLPHMPVAPLAVYRRFFGASVIANQERAALHVGRAMLRVAPRGANDQFSSVTGPVSMPFTGRCVSDCA